VRNDTDISDFLGFIHERRYALDHFLPSSHADTF
jgi:hypothetical protein